MSLIGVLRQKANMWAFSLAVTIVKQSSKFFYLTVCKYDFLISHNTTQTQNLKSEYE